MAVNWEKSVSVSKTSPAFLHANSTSHTWVFSALAELIDNAYDPDVSATRLNIDVETIKGLECLIFKDNGNGMNVDKLHKMLSFGYCEKVEISGHKPIGHYGNGFKSGSMRLGRDAIVFTKDKSSYSCGFLSQNFLKEIGAHTVLVPILSFDKTTKKLVERPDSKGSFKAILNHSLFREKDELWEQFADLDSLETDTGTKIIISDLKRGNNQMLELDFESDPSDIRNSEHQEFSGQRVIKEYTPEYRKSLREYCSILFLRPRMKIYIRDKKVKTKLVSKSLSRTEKDVYKPAWQTKPIKIIFGFGSSKEREDCGIMMYHRNRLIKAFEKVGCQKQADERGLGVVGVVAVDFLEPIHNKQDFNKTDRYNAFMNAIGTKLLDYWTEKTEVPMKVGNVTIIEPESNGLPDWTWVQCDNCLKWRRLPDGTDQNLPDKWFCYMNPDPLHCRCDADEEPEDEDELFRATYEKTYKQKQNKEKYMKKQSLTQKEHELRRKEQELQQAAIRLQQQQLQQPLADAPGENKPTIADLERARRDLKRMKQAAEEQQQRYARQMEQEKLKYARQMEVQQQQLIRNQSESSATFKRKSVESETASERKKSRTALETEDYVITKNESSSSDESNESDSDSSSVIVLDSDEEHKAWQKKKKGKLPRVQLGKKRNISEAEDVKPSVEELDNDMAAATTSKAKAAKTSTSNSSAKKYKGVQEKSSATTNVNNKASSSETSINDSGSNDIESSGKDANKSKSSSASLSSKISSNNNKETSSISDAAASCEALKKSNASLKKELDQCKKSLSTLRTNVKDLLKVIVPDLQVNELSFIDDIVVEMIKVNSQQNGTESPKATSNRHKQPKTPSHKEDSKKTCTNDTESEIKDDVCTENNVDSENSTLQDGNIDNPAEDNNVVEISGKNKTGSGEKKNCNKTSTGNSVGDSIGTGKELNSNETTCSSTANKPATKSSTPVDSAIGNFKIINETDNTIDEIKSENESET